MTDPRHRRTKPKEKSFSNLEKRKPEKEAPRSSRLKHRRKQHKRRVWRMLLLLSIIIAYLIVRLCFLEYSWVHRRCLVATLLFFNLQSQIECVEASTHMRAMQSPALLWPVDPSRTLSIQQMHQVQSNPPVHDVHFGMTEFLTNPNAMELALCSVEAAARQCFTVGSSSATTATEACRVNVWMVDGAAEKLKFNKTTTPKPVDALTVLLDKVGAPWCIHIVERSSLSRSYVGPDCPAHDTRPQSASSQKLLEWLSSDLARHQIAAHASDAWRLVVLGEAGGLYMDLDVVMLSTNLLKLPRNSIPVQSRVGAYRMNGGVLKLSPVQDSDSLLAGRHSWLRSSLRQKSLLDAVIEDHLRWAPRLATLPSTHKGQTFGFLGPCALTRVFLQQHPSAEEVWVLPEAVVEPRRLDHRLCNATTSGSWAIHFSGTRKERWRQMISSTPCLVDLFQRTICPVTMGSGGK